MMTDQKVAIPRFFGLQNNFLYWSAQLKAILKARPMWNVLWVYDAASSSSWPEMRVSDAESDISSDLEYSRDVACLLIRQGLAEVMFACIMQY